MFPRQLVRNFVTSAIRRSHDHEDLPGIPGKYLPFSIGNKYKMTLYFILFFGSAYSLPFLMVRHTLLKFNRPEPE